MSVQAAPARFDWVLRLNLAFSTLIFFIAARIYVLPKMSVLAPRELLVPILLLHSMRHLGMMFLTRGAVYPGLAPQFAYPAAFGDLLTSVLALVSLAAVTGGWKLSLPLLWIFNTTGTLDLLAAIALATVYNAPGFLGPAYWIPSFWVPALLVTHYLVFLALCSPAGPRLG
jgi:hypothetical protein